MSPSVSVVIAVKNGAERIGRAIESILAQDHEPLEIVVVDKESTDGSAEIAVSYASVRVIQQTGTGYQGAWNEGIAASTGALIAILDSDDMWLEGKLAAQIALLEGPPPMEWCYTHCEHVVEEGHTPPAGFRKEVIGRAVPTHMPSTLLARRTLFERVGGFREDFEIASDVEWLARVRREAGEPGMVERCLVRKFFHGDNLSHSDIDTNNSELLRVLRENVNARR